MSLELISINSRVREQSQDDCREKQGDGRIYVSLTKYIFDLYGPNHSLLEFNNKLECWFRIYIL